VRTTIREWGGDRCHGPLQLFVNAFDAFHWYVRKHPLFDSRHCHRVAFIAPPKHARRARHAVQPRHARVAKHANTTIGLPRARIGIWSAAAMITLGGVASSVSSNGELHPARVAVLASAAIPAVDPPASPASQGGATPAAVMPVIPGLAAAAVRLPASVDAASVAAVAEPAALVVIPGDKTIPRLARAAYLSAATAEAHLVPGCGLNWQILAGIGLIESDHARSGGSAKSTWSGVASPAILGPLLDGNHGYPAVKDTDHGVLDGNTDFDRAVGPMQFLPATWGEYAGPTHGTVAPNPENIVDAASAAGRYLCASDVDLRTPSGLIDAIYGYNHSFAYVTNVVSAAQRYANGDLPGATAALAELPALVAGEPTPSFLSDAVSAPLLSLAPHPSSVVKPSGTGSPDSTPSTLPVPLPAPLPQPNPTPSPVSSPILSSPPASTSDSPSSTPPDSSPPDSTTPTAPTSDSPSPSVLLPSSPSPAPGSPAPGSPAPSPAAS
jgi:membrane-bound lytic murein transglycosylase B